MGLSAANLCVHMLCSKSLTYDHRKLQIVCYQVHGLIQNLFNKGHQLAAYRSVSFGNRKKLKFVCCLELLLHPGTEHQFPPFKTFILHNYITTLSCRKNTAQAHTEVSMSWRMKITIYCPTSWLTHTHTHTCTGNQLSEIPQVLLLVCWLLISDEGRWVSFTFSPFYSPHPLKKRPTKKFIRNKYFHLKHFLQFLKLNYNVPNQQQCILIQRTSCVLQQSTVYNTSFISHSRW